MGAMPQPEHVVPGCTAVVRSAVSSVTGASTLLSSRRSGCFAVCRPSAAQRAGSGAARHGSQRSNAGHSAHL